MDGARDVLEVYELSNDSSVTRVSPDGTTPTWSAPLPEGAYDFTLGQMDLAPQTFRTERGRVVTVSPFAPGLRQFSYSYRLKANAFPLSVRVPPEADVVEVLAEEPRAVVEGAGVQHMPSVQTSGRTFERYLSQQVPPNPVVRVTVPRLGTGGPERRTLVILAVTFLAVMATALVLALRRRGVAVPARATDGPSMSAVDPARLARAIARLDHRMATARDAAERQACTAERDALRERLAAALATHERVP